MNYYSVLYRMPAEGLEAWGAKPESERKQAEDAMKAEWQAWLAAHADMVKNTIGMGKMKSVTSAGIQDLKNGIMLSSYVQAESLEAAAALFADYPHLKIPNATIEVMETKPL